MQIGRFYSGKETCESGFRCDLRSHWKRCGKRAGIDSTCRGEERPMYGIDVCVVVGE